MPRVYQLLEYYRVIFKNADNQKQPLCKNYALENLYSFKKK